MASIKHPRPAKLTPPGLCHRPATPVDGTIFGRLEIVEFAGRNAVNRHAMYICRCMDCGDLTTPRDILSLYKVKHGCQYCGKQKAPYKVASTNYGKDTDLKLQDRMIQYFLDKGFDPWT